MCVNKSIVNIRRKETINKKAKIAYYDFALSKRKNKW